jgi:hypothetical protein
MMFRLCVLNAFLTWYFELMMDLSAHDPLKIEEHLYVVLLVSFNHLIKVMYDEFSTEILLWKLTNYTNILPPIKLLPTYFSII